MNKTTQTFEHKAVIVIGTNAPNEISNLQALFAVLDGKGFEQVTDDRGNDTVLFRDSNHNDDTFTLYLFNNPNNEPKIIKYGKYGTFFG